MFKTWKAPHFQWFSKNYRLLVTLSQTCNGAQAFSQAVIDATQEGNVRLIFCLFRYALFYERLIASPDLLRDIIVAIPLQHEAFVINLLSQDQFIHALLKTENAAEYINDLAKTYPGFQMIFFKSPLSAHITSKDLPAQKIYKSILNSPYAAECIYNIAILNRQFAHALFINHHTKENYHYSKMLQILSHSPKSIEFFIRIIKTHQIDFYIKKARPNYNLDFCTIEIDLICHMIFRAFTCAYVEHPGQRQPESKISPQIILK